MDRKQTLPHLANCTDPHRHTGYRDDHREGFHWERHELVSRPIHEPLANAIRSDLGGDGADCRALRQHRAGRAQADGRVRHIAPLARSGKDLGQVATKAAGVRQAVSRRHAGTLSHLMFAAHRLSPERPPSSRFPELPPARRVHAPRGQPSPERPFRLFRDRPGRSRRAIRDIAGDRGCTRSS
jgi:hypothetical protein